ncbi:MAG: hypothetical protein J2P57_22700, partial [Acidimicrobiaceae bacterium]|nr:hypothetical protein [Acidimicrobiaceae bacterium]
GIGSSHGTSPPVIQPGEWALAAISFPSAARLSTSDTMSFNVKAPPAASSSFNAAAIEVTQANLSGSAIRGGVRNTTGKMVTGPVIVDVYCFDEASKPVYTQGGSTSGAAGDLAPNATEPFQINISGQLCPSYLVGASGHHR